MSGKRFRSNLSTIAKTIDEVRGNFKNASAKLEDTAMVMKNYAVKTNAGIFNELSGIFESQKDPITDILKLLTVVEEAAQTAHNEMQKRIDSLDD